MNNKKAKEIVVYTLLFMAWALSGLNKTVHLETIVSILVFISSGVIYFFVKNPIYKLIGIIVATAATTIYSFEYILLSIPVL